MHTAILSLLFITLYGSGFVATQFGIPYTDPLSFLTYRFFITAIILTIVCLVIRARWPSSVKEVMHQSIAGALIVGTFSIGVFISIDQGTSAATSALIISFQPLIASLLSFLIMRTKINRPQWIGLIMGLLGVSFIVFSKLSVNSLSGIMMSVLGLLGLAFGSLYQKAFCANMNIFSGGVIHTSSSAVLCLLISLFYGDSYTEWQPEFIFSLLWMSIVVSIGALSILYVLIRKLEISQVSSLFYLIPVSSVILSIIFLDESLNTNELVGILITSVAVFMVNSSIFRSTRPTKPI
ncbi:DMT family transporter [Oceanospirillum maris]|jgi:drug/metabolite transporter (DMT)-like permease|uniref:DMT family transporter n=1 Tax=Oceanospirillum maris TaxID=64977 RepID=UPI0004120294|nr:DMT family transporter [Oceanospirillum maris]